MNSIQALTDSILAQAQAEADTFLRNEMEKCAQELSDSEKQLETQFAEQKEQLAAHSEERVQLALLRKRSALQKERTRYKQDLLDKLFAEAEDSLCRISGADFLAFYRQMLTSVELKGSFVAHIGAKSAQQFTAEDWAALNINGDSYDVRPAKETIPGKGGFVLEQSSLEFSFLFGELLADIKYRTGAELLKQLLD